MDSKEETNKKVYLNKFDDLAHLWRIVAEDLRAYSFMNKREVALEEKTVEVVGVATQKAGKVCNLTDYKQGWFGRLVLCFVTLF